MPEKRWKATERAIAQKLGGQRVPVSGRARGDQPDIRHEWLSPEVKHPRTLPAWLLMALDQATRAATKDQTPIAILHNHGDR